MSKDPLTSVLSLGGERKIREWVFSGGMEWDLTQ
jgi:hypothetical protein